MKKIAITKVKVGMRGIHYHLPDCPVVSGESFPVDNYMEIEVPRLLVDMESPINFLEKDYISHVEACKLLIKERGH